MGRRKNPEIALKELTLMNTEAYDQDELIDELDWAGYDFGALPVYTRDGYWADCDFSGAKAQDTRWNHSYMRDANFEGADLRGADFYGAYLANANFRGADLTNASFEMANLTGADFTGCELPGLDAFHTAYLGRGSRERIIRVSGLPDEAIDLAVATSRALIANCEAAGTNGPYVRMDPAVMSDELDKE